jgi:hypothetical protein
MQKAGAKLILFTLFLTASVAWMPVDASIHGLKLQVGGPIRPSTPSAPDGGNPFPTCPPQTACSSFALR